jgi:hypothetical protein
MIFILDLLYREALACAMLSIWLVAASGIDNDENSAANAIACGDHTRE